MNGWPTYSPDESIEERPAEAILTDRHMAMRGYLYPASWEYEYGWWTLGHSRETATFLYEIGQAAFTWAERETRKKMWVFQTYWGGE